MIIMLIICSRTRGTSAVQPPPLPWLSCDNKQHLRQFAAEATGPSASISGKFI